GDTDVIGWFEQPTTLGLLATDVVDASARAGELNARVRNELSSRVDAAMLRRFCIQLHIHQDPKSARSEGARPVDPLLEDVPPRTLRRASNQAFKRTLDLVGSLTLLAVVSPLFLLIGVLIKITSPGPIFFRQERVGHRMK